MSATFVLICTVLTLVSAFVAYLGDMLGRHIGKRRVRLFGLRPRVSAIVVTSITGGLITLLTIIVLVSTSDFIRNMAKTVDEVMAQERLAQAKQQEATRVIADSEAAIKRSQDEQRSLENEMAATETERARLQTELDKLDLTVKEQQQQSAALRKELATLEGKRAAQAREIEANSAYILQQETAIANLQRETTSLQQTVKTYREGDIVVVEGTRLAGEYFSTSTIERRESLVQQLPKLQDDVVLPPGLTVRWPTPDDYQEIARQIRTQGEDWVAVELVAAENVVQGGVVKVQVGVIPQLVVYPKGTRLYDQVVRTEMTETARRKILEELSQNAIQKGLRPLMGDTRVTLFDSLGLTRFNTDLQGMTDKNKVTTPTRLIFMTTQPVWAFDALEADRNFTWYLIPVDPEKTP